MTVSGLVLAVLLAGAPEEATAVVVLPVEARGVAEAVAEAATDAMVEAIADAPGLEIIGPRQASRRYRVDLGLQARSCAFDVFCLVEVARLLSGQVVLVGQLDRIAGRSKAATSGEETGADLWVLSLQELAVDRATLVETLRFEVEVGDLGGLRDAAAAGAMRLSAPTDATIELALDPPSARLWLYGEAVPLAQATGRLSWWAGRWRFRVVAPGYEPQTGTLVLPRGEVVPLEVALDQDPLHVEISPQPPPEPFERPSRRRGSGVTVEEAGLRRVGPEPPSRFARPLPWVGVGLGAAALGVGLGLVLDARGGYAGLANETRFVPGAATPSDVAAADRDRFQQQHLVGSSAAIAGTITAVLALGWMLLLDPDEGTETDAP